MILTLIAVVVLAALALVFLRPAAIAGARPADTHAAKAAGEALLASRDTTALIVVAHPDDTEWWAGGTAAALAEHNTVVLLMGTSGDKGAGGNVPGLGAVRERLQREAGRIIGYRDIVFLRHPDQGLAQAGSLPGEIRDAFARFRPDVVLTFDTGDEASGYHHPDHEAAGRAATAVARQLGGVTLYLFHTSKPDVIVDYAPVKERKRAAFRVLQEYRSANPTFGWLIGPLSMWMTRGVGYGEQVRLDDVGITYGETFRTVVVPPR